MKTTKFFVVLGLLTALVAPSFAQTKSATLSLPQEPDTLNMMYSDMTFAGYAAQLVLAPAWDFDGEGNPHAVLAAEIPSVENGGVSEDGKTYTIKLKEGLTWSDGDALDSADFVFTYEMYTSEANNPNGRAPYDSIESVEGPDSTTVVVTYKEPYVPWLGMFRYVLPEHVLRPVFDAEGSLDNAEFNGNPTVASGPYTLVEWSRGSFMRLAANPSFAGGTAKIADLVVTFISDSAAYKTTFLNGEAQLGTFLDFSDVPDLTAAGYDVQVVASGYNEGMFFNVGDNANPAMKDVNVRKALALGFNRQAVVSDLLLGGTVPAATPWENTPFASPDLEPVPYDPEQAKQLLADAGYADSDGDGILDKDGNKLTIRFVTNQRGIRKDIQALAQQQWGELGIEVTLENYESDQFFASFKDNGPVALGNYDVAEWSSAPATFPDPDTTRFDCDQIPSPDNLTGGNYVYYCNPELDALLKQQRSEFNAATRLDLWHQITEILYNDYVWVGVWYDADLWWTGAGLTAGAINSVSPWWDIVNWDVE